MAPSMARFPPGKGGGEGIARGGKGKGILIHSLTEGGGMPLANWTTPANGDERAQVLMQDGRPAANLFASGEIMAGNILGRGYLAGFGMTIGTVFGRIAGEQAARHARN